MFRTRLLALASVAVAALLSRTAHAEGCRQYLVPAVLEIHQSNNYHVTLMVKQDETGAFSGTASYPLASGELVVGNATGAIGARGKFDLLISWPNGTVGDYTAWVTPEGRIIEGTGFDRSRPESRATWTSEQTLGCAD